MYNSFGGFHHASIHGAKSQLHTLNVFFAQTTQKKKKKSNGKIPKLTALPGLLNSIPMLIIGGRESQDNWVIRVAAPGRGDGPGCLLTRTSWSWRRWT